jgi:hypothetical protein
VQGRLFEEADGKRNVAIIDEWMARRYFPGKSALGQRFEGSRDGTLPPIEVVGVVGHVESYGLDGKGPVDISWYVPLEMAARVGPQFSTNVSVVVRTVSAGCVAGQAALADRSSAREPNMNSTSAR